MYFVSVGAMEDVKLSEIHVQRFCQSGALDEAFSQHQRINRDDMGVMLRCSGELLSKLYGGVGKQNSGDLSLILLFSLQSLLLLLPLNLNLEPPRP